MCNLCSINHFSDDEFDDEHEYDEAPTVCVHGASQVPSVSCEMDLTAQSFKFVSAGSSF